MRLSRQKNVLKQVTLIAVAFFFVLLGSSRADDGVAAAQQALKSQGFYYGKITGRKDADTTASLRRYQIRNGLKITGELNTETQQSLRITGTTPTTTVPQRTLNEPSDLHEGEERSRISPPQYQSPRESSVPIYAPDSYSYRQEPAGIFQGTPYEMASPDVQERVIADAQIFLARRGYYRSEIDGIYGAGTAFGLRTFQSRSGLPPTGRFDKATLSAMGLMRRQHLTAPGRRFPPRVYRGEWIQD